MTKVTQKTVEPEKPISAVDKWRIADTPGSFTLNEIFDMTTLMVAKAKDSMVDYEICVGTDSQIIKHGYRFVTVLCVYLKGKGGMYYYFTDYKETHNYNPHNKKMRMFDEVGISVEIANELFEKTGLTSTIHIDASPEDKKEFTSSIVEQLKGYAISCGFEVKIKPDSYASCFLADKHSKARVDKKRKRHSSIRNKKA